MLQRMCRRQDRLIAIKEGDMVVMVTPPVPGTEKMASRTIDILYKSGAKVNEIKKDILRSSHADRDDLKMLYNMLNPKYIIPIIGEYRHQYTQKHIALEAGYDESKIIILENGEIAGFENGKYVKGKKVSAGDVLVDGSMIGDINEFVLKDREFLAQEGLVLISVIVDTSKRKIVAGPEVVSKGLIVSQSLEQIITKVKDIINDEVKIGLSKKNIDLDFIKNGIRDSVSHMLYRTTKKKPIIMPTIINIQNK
jgi:ribonuclease J